MSKKESLLLTHQILSQFLQNRMSYINFVISKVNFFVVAIMNPDDSKRM